MNPGKMTKPQLLDELANLKNEITVLKSELTGQVANRLNTSDKIINRIADEISATTGDLFFEKFVLSLGEELGVEYTYVGKISKDRLKRGNIDVIEMVSFSSKNTLSANITFPIKGSVCSEIKNSGVSIYTEKVQRLFPEDECLERLKVESLVCVPLSDISNHPVGIIVVMDTKPIENSDLIVRVIKHFTGRVNAELERLIYIHKLLESEIRFLQVTENSEDWIWEVDTRGKFIYSSSSIEKMLGYKPQEIVGKKHFFDLFIQEDKKRLKTESLRLFTKREKVKNLVTKSTHKNGNIVWLSTSGTPVIDSKGTFLGYRGTNHNITEQVLNSQTLEIKDAALNYSLNGIAITGLNGKLIYVNDSFLKMWKYETLIEVLGLHLTDFWENQKAALDVQNKLKRLFRWQGELTAKRKDQSNFIASLNASVIKGAEGIPVGMIATFFDITRDRKVSEALDIALHLSTKLEDASIDEVMQLGLEECERITQSKIGYFHFVNQDQESIELKTWSSNTKKDCEVAEKNTLYPVSKAGIWLDCLREKRPIITNDYENHPHKKGLPKGHAVLKRELDLPVFEGDKITAVIGVGNKETDYTELDLELVQLIADNVWGIVRRKKVEQALKENKQRLKLAIEGTAAGTWDWDFRSGIVTVNEKWAKIIGYELDELLPVTYEKWQAMIYQEDLASVEQTVKAYLSGATGNYENEFRMKNKNGSLTWILSRGKIFERDADGNPLRMSGTHLEISQRKETERALRESEEKYKTVADYTYDWEYWQDTNKKFQYISPASERITGYTAKEFLADDNLFFNIVHPEDRHIIELHYLEDFYNEIDTCEKEFRIINKSGDVNWISHICQPVFDNQGKFMGRRGSNRDITEKKLATEELKSSEKKFRRVVENAQAIIFMVDTDLKFTLSDGKGLSVLGIKPNQVVGQSVYDVYNNYPQIISNIKRTLKGEFVKDNVDVSGLIFETHYSPMYDPAGEVNGLIGIAVDVTERYAAEEHLRKLSRAVDQSQVSIAILDVKGNIEYVNPKFLKVSGFEYSELVGKSSRILDSRPNSKKEQEKIWEQLLTGNEWSGIFQNKKKTGEIIWESAIISPVKNNRGKITHFVEVKEDITDKIKSERELEKYRKSLEILVKRRTTELETASKKLAREIVKQKEAEVQVKKALEKEKELSELKTRFISTASHEFRTPLTSIMTSAEILDMFGLECSREEFSEQIERIIGAVEYLTRLMDDVLTVSRTDAGKIKFEPEQVDFYQLCVDILRDIKLSASEKHELQFNFMPAEKKFAVDEKLMRFIILNLLSNAIKYSPQGGEIVFDVYIAKGHLVLNIKDNGLGIPEKDQKHLFEPFHRAVNTRDLPGTGLGLSIVKKSVELHNGEISYQSVENEGTTFNVSIPI